MGDFHKGNRFPGLPEELVRHIRLHRYIDGLTRTSEFFQNSRKRLDPELRHARSILVDVFYDHFLAIYWEHFSDISLKLFSDSVYAGLEDCYDLLSPGLQRQLPHMVQHNWLLSYRKPATVHRVLVRLEQRLGGKVALVQGFEQLELYHEQLKNDFFAFMWEVSEKVSHWKHLY